MLGQGKIRRLEGLLLLQTVAGSFLIFSGALILLGWIFGLRTILTFGANYVPATLVSGCFFLMIGLFLVFEPRLRRKSNPKPGLILLFSVLSLYGLLKLIGYFLQINLTLDQFVFPIINQISNHPFRPMTPSAGLFFFLSGLAIVLKLLNNGRERIDNLIASLGVLVVFAGFVAGLGYLLGSPFLYSNRTIAMSGLTAITFFVQGFGLLFMAGEKTIYLRQFFGPTAKAKLLRLFIPLVVFLIVLQGVMDVIFTHYFVIHEALMLSVLTLCSVVFSILLIMNITKRIFLSADKAELERIKVLEELKKVNLMQSLILENSSMGIYMVQNRIIQWANNRFSEIFNIPANEIRGASTRIVYPSDTAYREYESFYQLLRERKTVDVTLELSRRDGQPFWCRFIGTALDPENPYEGSVWMVEDITERKRLRERMRLLSHTVESLSECISITDTVDKIIYVNEAFQSTYGYRQEELLGRNISMVRSSANDTQKVGKVLPSTLDGGWQGELINRRKDGAEFPVFLNTSKVIDENGEVVALVGVATDITERKKTEQQLKQYAEELRIANEAKDKLFSIISHDLRSPFNAILGFFQLLNDRYDSFTEEEKKTIFKEFRKSSENTFQLLDNLLTWSRTQTGGIKVAPSAIDLARLADQLMELLRPAAQAKRIELLSSVDKGTQAWADGEMIKTVLLNLLNNAVKFTRPGGSIRLSAVQRSTEVEITVEDNGVGIGEADLERMFTLKQSASLQGTSDEKGTGLGLLICKEFVEKNGGRIRVESQLGKGSKFIFTLPNVVVAKV